MIVTTRCLSVAPAYGVRVHQFFHAVSVFGHELVNVGWTFLGLALLLHVLKLMLRAIAWRSILVAAYPTHRIRLRTTLGAYVAGVGVNSIAPARSGDLVKLYLVRARIPGAKVTTLAPTLVAETAFDAIVAGGLMLWALAIGVLPTRQVYEKLPTVEWRFFFRHVEATGIVFGLVAVAVVISLFWARGHIARFFERIRQGFAVFSLPRRLLLGVVLPQALSWILRIATLYCFLRAFHIDATVHNAMLAQVVDSLATLFPATPGGAGTKQGLIVYVFRGQAVSTAALLAFSVGMNIAIVISNVVLGLIAMGLMARTFSWRALFPAQPPDDEPANA